METGLQEQAATLTGTQNGRDTHHLSQPHQETEKDPWLRRQL
ncbi:MAG: hypothetical protein OJF52_001806 [Nitrospira sp.]|nr:MAG: hypothetical protein OJF52_001806 [Nitrospira sp.]